MIEMLEEAASFLTVNGRGGAAETIRSLYREAYRDALRKHHPCASACESDCLEDVEPDFCDVYEASEGPMCPPGKCATRPIGAAAAAVNPSCQHNKVVRDLNASANVWRCVACGAEFHPLPLAHSQKLEPKR